MKKINIESPMGVFIVNIFLVLNTTIISGLGGPKFFVFGFFYQVVFLLITTYIWHKLGLILLIIIFAWQKWKRRKIKGNNVFHIVNKIVAFFATAPTFIIGSVLWCFVPTDWHFVIGGSIISACIIIILTLLNFFRPFNPGKMQKILDSLGFSFLKKSTIGKLVLCYFKKNKIRILKEVFRLIHSIQIRKSNDLEEVKDNRF